MSVYHGKPLVNSVTGEEERLEVVLPLIIKKFAMLWRFQMMKPVFLKIRMRVMKLREIVERAADYGIPREDVVVDPLIMPVGAMNMAGRSV